MRLDLGIDKTPDEQYLQSLMLAEVLKRILKVKGEVELSSVPTIKKKPIVEFVKRMRIDGAAKFGEKAFISTINFYVNETASENHDALGAVILYIPESYINKLLNDLEYPVAKDDDDPDNLEDACGSLCNLIAGNFKNGLTQLGYKELFMSHFSTYQNEVINGVEFDSNQKTLFEISFEIGGERKIVIDFTMGPVPRLSDL